MLVMRIYSCIQMEGALKTISAAHTQDVQLDVQERPSTWSSVWLQIEPLAASDQLFLDKNHNKLM